MSKRKSGKFRREREKKRQKKRKEEPQPKKKKANNSRLKVTSEGVFKVNKDGHLRGKLKLRKIHSSGLIKQVTRLKSETLGNTHPQMPKSVKESSSDSEDESQMKRFAEVAVNSTTVLQSAEALTNKKRKARRGQTSTHRSKERRHRHGDSEDDTPDLERYQIKTQELLHKHLDETFGALLDENREGEKNRTPSTGKVKKEKKKAKAIEIKGGDEEGIQLFRKGPKVQSQTVQS